MKKTTVHEHRTRLLAIALVLTLCIVSVSAAASDSEPAKTNKPRYVILLIGDGMGFNQVAAASYYATGKRNGCAWSGFPVALAMSTYPSEGSYLSDAAWLEPDYLKLGATDSAAAATALSTGRKTILKAIGVGPQGNPLTHLMENAEAKGKATGVVTSVPISHATPAGFIAHNPQRYNYAQIANEMFFDSAVDVIMGAGHPYFDDDNRRCRKPISFSYVGGSDTWEKLVGGKALGADSDGDGKLNKWTLITANREFRKLRKGKTPTRVVGIAQVHKTLQYERSVAVGQADAAIPFATPMNAGIPSLAMMTEGALNVLDNDPDGFVLMVEGGAIDWACHDNNAARMIEEVIAFGEAVEAAVDWVEKNSDWDESLVIVMADHETGYLLGPCLKADPQRRVVNGGKGELPGVSWHSGAHTNSLVPVFARGAAAQDLGKYADLTDPVRGRYLDNTELARFIIELLR